MMIEHIKLFLQANAIPFEENVDLKTRTWIHRGGQTTLFVTPVNLEQLKKVVAFLYEIDYKFLILGHTSNVYIHNNCNQDIVISTILCNKYSFNNETVTCDCGTPIKKLAYDSISRGLRGLEYMTTLPGTVAAAIYNNSSCGDSSVSALVTEIATINPDGIVHNITSQELGFQFRSSAFKRHEMQGVILSIKLKLQHGNRPDLMQAAEDNERERKRILEGPSQNLGCTVNRCFSNGEMPKKWAYPFSLFCKFLSLFKISSDRKKELQKVFILRLTGYSDLIPYISNKQMIIFIWKDEKADDLFPKYLDFMKKVYKTNSVEIEEIRNVNN